MALNTVSTGNTILAADINQLVNVLQRPSGQTETGNYFLTFNSSAAGYYGAIYIPSQSRNATPVSVTIDTSGLAPVGCNTPTAAQLTSSGFQIYDTSTGVGGNNRCGGIYTIQY